MGIFTKKRKVESDLSLKTTLPSTSHESAPECKITFEDGVKILHDPPDAVVDIYCIHGLTGNRDTTWTAAGQEESWLVKLLAPRLQACILTYGFDAYVARKFAPASINRLFDQSKNFLVDVTNDREARGATNRPLIVFAHSAGGIVFKQAVLLSRSHVESHLHDMFDSLIGVMFMGTPHEGSWIADWATIPASVLGLFKSTNLTLLQVLQTENQLLETIQDGFLSMLREQQLKKSRKIAITCFFEELPMFGKLIVPKRSAIFHGYDFYSIHASHKDMVKFVSAEETGFRRIFAELNRWQKNISKKHDSCGNHTEAKLAPTKQNLVARRHLKAERVSAGNEATQVFEAGSVTANDIMAGDRSVQYFGDNAGIVVDIQPRQKRKRRLSVEPAAEEILEVFATGSTARCRSVR